MKEGPALAFNLQALENAAGPIFIVEGEIDALSVIQAGGEAVGLGGTNGANQLLKALEKHKPQQPLILALDKDGPGQKAEKDLLAALGKLQIPYLQADIAGARNDPNAALLEDPAGFTAAVQEAIAAGTEKNREAEAARQERTGAGMVDHFLEAIQTRKYEPMPTGITDIDRAIGGGFIRQQLVLLGAAPGAGKTALAQWIFEGMAKRGTACIYLNLEMAQDQILARSISRIVAQRGGAIKTTEILQGYRWTDPQRAQILAAAATYREEIAPRMIYNPPGVTANLDSILDYMEQEAQRAKSAGDQAPVCVLDYLQLVSGSEREDSAAVIKRAVAGLKAYAIRHNTLVFVIIAHNRESNKSGAVTMEAGRDTSALEYSADLQMALTYTLCMKRGEKKAKAPDDLTEDEKQCVTLKITKGRFGGAGKCVDLHFNGETMTYTQIITDFDPPAFVQKRL
ncbi:MAG: bifunctional DNA primase/helicase [Eubacteriales bacterium]|nr:bifunctional DNA primase/helicase [Eubacteriales bacterium]